MKPSAVASTKSAVLATLLAGGIIMVLLWAPGETPSRAAPAAFIDRTRSSGIDFSYSNGEEADLCTILEPLGGGMALFDFDGDGLLDVFVVGGGCFTGVDKHHIAGQPCKLYRNVGGWKFADVTARAGLDVSWPYTHGCAVADYDCDGWPDLLVTGYGKLALFHNEGDSRGGRRFVDVTRQAGLTAWVWGTSAAWADLDGDGFPDLYVCQYVDWNWKTHHVCAGDHRTITRDICGPERYPGLPHRLFRNNRDGTFKDVSDDAGLQPECTKGLGVVIVDVNDDHRPDIYAVNDTVRNFLYINKSKAGRARFLETGFSAGAAVGDSGIPDGSMGVDAADYDGCGRASLLVTTFVGEIPALYHNEGRIPDAGVQTGLPLFRYLTPRTGLAAHGTSFVGFGTAFLDLDLDGWEDLVIVNGHVRRFPTRCGVRQRPLLFRNRGDGTFHPLMHGGDYFDKLHCARGLAVGDLDNDGRPDLVISHMNAPVAVLQNSPSGTGDAQQHWLGIDLRGRNNRDVTGAKVVVELGNRRISRFAKAGRSYLSASDSRLLFGLGSTDCVRRITVFWPWAGEESWENLVADRYWRLGEGERQPQAGS